MRDEEKLAESSEVAEYTVQGRDDHAAGQDLEQGAVQRGKKALEKILEMPASEKMTDPPWRESLQVLCPMLKIPDEKEQFLLAGKAGELDLWFLGVYMGLPLAELQEMRKNEQAEGEIRARILQHIRQHLPVPEGTEQKIRELQQQTKEALEDYAYIRDTYLKEIADGRKREREAQQKALEAKEETICIQKERITELEGKIRSLKRGQKQADPAGVEKEQGKLSFLQRLRRCGKGADILRFRETYLDDTEYSAEQKEFLLCCLEEGLSYDDLARFASPALTPEQMGRLRRIYEKRYRK